ncbi:uncharacterized protein with SCP/PR1 domains [Thermaerobacter subterraneus DSM 13965]|uniref:Uncharacterized protein with SCP/PR1 domains n=1 Tax=Thermaerobacter subterraneus DSM 13965 TaxID=867903 RepID=K6QCV2_9FIRM|nr:uncharacterized protein with SCP/PR1 domains [Thermaerobacter subterraneus DSM 13965]
MGMASLWRRAAATAAALLLMAVTASPAQASWYLVRSRSAPAGVRTASPPAPAPVQQPQQTAPLPGTGNQAVDTARPVAAGSPSWYYAWKLAILRQRSADGTAGPATQPAPAGGSTPAAPVAPTPRGSGPGSAPSTPAPAAPSPSSPAVRPALTAAEKHLVDLVNDARRDRGLPALAVDPDLVRLARLKAEDLRARGYFDHVSPTYGSPYEMERRAGISARVMGAENLAMSRDVDRAHLQLMASEGHRANLLNPSHDAIGVAVVPIPYGVLVVQLFLGDRYR